jgi:hypothetical protein
LYTRYPGADPVLEFVNGFGVTEESAILPVETGVATRFFVDLDFVASLQFRALSFQPSDTA